METKYGEHIPRKPVEDFEYTAEDFIAQLDRMKESFAGFDGWTRKALRILPMKAWQDRARIENLAKDVGTLPDAYLHAPLPMLPKGQALRPEQHRGITIFSMVHRVVIGALWTKLQPWQESWIHPSQHGGRKGGEHLADAWDLQMSIEEAATKATPLAGALLDYEKFFDYFQPDLVQGMLKKAGLPEGIANQIHYMYKNLQRRYIKVAGTFGGVIRQSNGVGQGCSMSLSVANLYVTSLFRYLRSNFPNIKQGDLGDLVEVLEAMAEFDKCIGLETNFTKNGIFGNIAAFRKATKSVASTRTGHPSHVHWNVVGYQITPMQNRNVQHRLARCNSVDASAR